MDFLKSIKSEFYKANKEQDTNKISQVLTEFDDQCRSAIEGIKIESEKEQLIRECIDLQKELLSCLEVNKIAIKKEIHNTKSNSTKINKYLNV
ncbi:hypothetical protein N9L48_00945 [Psychrosphaera sp.]|nr:hypothetical protein [Psychrosphaera sp.]